jgi:hypothetical protein
MTSSADVQKTILRNKLLGRWAAEKIGMTGKEADAYSDALARSTVDPKSNDVFAKIRKDFDAAGVAETDERILHVMTELMLQAGNLMPTAQGNSPDAAAVMLARNLMSR